MSNESVHNIHEFNAMTLLQARLASKGTGPQSTPSKGTIDPYRMMLGRKAENAAEATAPVQSWPVEDIKKLEEFCLKHGIVGFNTGRLPPSVALGLLKAKLGMVDEKVSSTLNPKQVLYGTGTDYIYNRVMEWL